MSEEKKLMKDVISEQLARDIEEAYTEILMYAKSALDQDQILKKLRRNFTDEVIEVAFERYNQSSFAKSKNSILQGERYTSRLNWYSPPINPSEDSRWGKLKLVLTGKGWPESNIKVLDEQSNDVVSSLASPKSLQPEVVKGLVIGYVQSGKTANFSAVIAKATDEGYRLVIVLSGRHNGLRSQTEKRLKSELIAPHGDSNSFTLTDVGPDGDFKKPTQSPNSLLTNENKFALVVMKKNTTPLNKFLSWIKEASDDVIENCPVLIIDDEADEASVNNSRNEEDPTKINKAIRQMIDFFSKRTQCSYVGYTATPFANILIDANENSDLFPKDFIVALKAPDTYVGAERLFGRASVDNDGGEPGLDLIREIPAGDSINNDEDEIEDKLPKSLKKAILSFLLSGGERIRRGQLNKHITMLIHTSHLKSQHTLVCKIVDAYKKEIDVALENDDLEFLNELREIWNSDFVRTNNLSFPNFTLGTFEQVVEGIKHFVLKFDKAIKENSESDFRLDFDSGPVWGIVIGGNTLSRGLTVEGLTTTYFHRNTDGYDTLLQMGRWFGYRPDYLDLVRIYVSGEMRSNFFHIATVEQELREDIDRMQLNNERPIDIALKIRDHDALTITNKLVLKKNGTFASNSYSASKIQATHLFIDDEKKASKNFEVVKSFLGELEIKKLRAEVKFPSFSRSYLYKHVSSNLILEFLNSYSFSIADRKFMFPILGKYISELTSHGELNDWSVAVISTEKPDETRSIDLGVGNLKVFGVSRRFSATLSKNVSEEGVVVKNITIPRDELIDLDDLEGEDIAQKLEKSSLTESVNPIRNKRPKGRGLLLIYPIYTHWNLSQDQIKELKRNEMFEPVVAKFKHLFGITVVFPPTSQEKFEFSYIANATLDSFKSKKVG
jgi:hypothetical protein